MNNTHDTSTAYEAASFTPSNFSLESPARKIDRHPHAHERIEAKRAGILREYGQRDQDIFAESMDAFAERQSLMLR